MNNENLVLFLERTILPSSISQMIFRDSPQGRSSKAQDDVPSEKDKLKKRF